MDEKTTEFDNLLQQQERLMSEEKFVESSILDERMNVY